MKYYAVDAFSDSLFGGNPAGVCLPDRALDASLMQQIAAENNLAETAFAVKSGDHYDLRWFTPETEIDLCGHATLATGFVLMGLLDRSLTRVDFLTQSGPLSVEKTGEHYSMDFPSRPPVPCAIPAGLEEALGAEVLECRRSRDLMVLLKDEEAVRNLAPDFALLRGIKDFFGFIVTAKGESCDFVSRFFAPNAGIDEDPVTGSSHCTLIPYWAESLSKDSLRARQLSRRGGSLLCELKGDRVAIGGGARLYLTGEIALDSQ